MTRLLLALLLVVSICLAIGQTEREDQLEFLMDKIEISQKLINRELSDIRSHVQRFQSRTYYESQLFSMFIRVQGGPKK